jgi:hypothetical protein
MALPLGGPLLVIVDAPGLGVLRAGWSPWVFLHAGSYADADEHRRARVLQEEASDSRSWAVLWR